MSKPTLKVTSDFTKQFNDIVKKFKNEDVLVGIPAADSERKSEQGSPQMITNAALLAINEFGSPLNNIPPRPVMKIGIKNAQEEIASQFETMTKNIFKTMGGSLDIYFNRIGIIASNSIKKAINSQEDIDPPSEATLAARAAKGFKGTKALIVTGQMRNAITYVLRNKKGS